MTGGLLLAALLGSGCATKNEMNGLNREMADVRSEWAAFEAGYDPAMRAELERNLERLKALNTDVALLREEVGLKARRVSELLAQIDGNQLDLAVQSCRRYALDADYFAATAQRHSDAALSYFEATQQQLRETLHRHEMRMHRVDVGMLLKKIETLEKEVARLQRDAEGKTPERDGREPREGEGRR